MFRTETRNHAAIALATLLTLVISAGAAQAVSDVSVSLSLSADVVAPGDTLTLVATAVNHGPDTSDIWMKVVFDSAFVELQSIDDVAVAAGLTEDDSHAPAVVMGSGLSHTYEFLVSKATPHLTLLAFTAFATPSMILTAGLTDPDPDWSNNTDGAQATVEVSTAATPEPNAALLFGIGSVLLAGRMHRRASS